MTVLCKEKPGGGEESRRQCDDDENVNDGGGGEYTEILLLFFLSLSEVIHATQGSYRVPQYIRGTHVTANYSANNNVWVLFIFVKSTP